MKKVTPIVLFILFIVGLYWVTDSFKQGKGVPVEDVMDRMFSFTEASVQETPINDSIAQITPQTFLFTTSFRNSANGSEAAVVVMNTLSKTIKEFGPALLQMRHGNITTIKVDEQVYGLIPKHMFGEDIDLVQLLEGGGFSPSVSKDFLTVRLKEGLQASITANLFETLDPKQLEGVPCIVQTVNCYDGDPTPFRYVMHGILQYITPSEQKALNEVAMTREGKKATAGEAEGMFVVRIPDRFSQKVFGMSGGSVTAIVDGKEYFIGMNDRRLRPIMSDGTTAKWGTFLGIQPITTGDFPQKEKIIM